jgi:GNAT superfamily N-acetyltransferase
MTRTATGSSSRKSSSVLRPVELRDLRFLRDMLRHAYYWRLDEDRERPVYRYVQNWGRTGDAGVIALEGPHPAGAAWYRLFDERAPGFGFVDERTPELTIAVVPSRRGKGTGKEMLTALLDRARADGYDAVSLSAAHEQTEYYGHFAFEPVRETRYAVTRRLALIS